MTIEEAKSVRIGDTLYCITDDQIVELEVVCVSDGYIMTCLDKKDRESSVSMGCQNFSYFYEEILQVQYNMLLRKKYEIEELLKYNRIKMMEL